MRFPAAYSASGLRMIMRRCIQRFFYDIVILETWAFLNMGYDDLPLNSYPYLYSLPVVFPEEVAANHLLYQNINIVPSSYWATLTLTT